MCYLLVRWKKIKIEEKQTKIKTGDVLQNIPTVINGVRCGETKAVARALEDISQSIQDMTDALKLMQGNHSNITYVLVLVFIYSC